MPEANVNKILTIIWIINYRLSPKDPQVEVIRYTKAAALALAEMILEQGGTAVVIEDVEESPVSGSGNELDWSS